MTAPIRSGGTNPKDLVGAKKAPLSLVPQALVIGASEAMENGASKYGAFNWREYPVQMMTYVEAAQRHLAAFIDGQDSAEDTGIHHLKHVAASMAILLDSIGLGIVVDNRPPKGPAADLLRVLDKTAKSNRPLILKADEPMVIIEPWGTGDGPILSGTSGLLEDAPERFAGDALVEDVKRRVQANIEFAIMEPAVLNRHIKPEYVERAIRLRQYGLPLPESYYAPGPF